jgi:biopolymer transport protein ExbD
MPVAPMLDMAFQILAFFILIYHPANAERAIPVNSSQSQSATSTIKKGARPIIVDIVADSSHGSRAKYRLRTDDQKNTALCDVQTLRDRLKSCRFGAAVQISAQAGIAMSDVVAAVDAAAAAGLSTISFAEAVAPLPVRK